MKLLNASTMRRHKHTHLYMMPSIPIQSSYYTLPFKSPTLFLNA